MTGAGQISGVIPTVGRAGMLRLCLASVIRQTVPIAEVLVVHCGSDPDTQAVCLEPRWRDAGVDVRYFAFAERNAAAQRNFAIDHAKYDNLLLLDDDVELEAEWAASLFEPIWSDAAVGATMGRLVNQPIPPPTAWWRAYRRLVAGRQVAFEPGRLLGAAMPNGFPTSADRPMPSEWLGGGVSALRRAAFRSVGGFAPYFSGSSPGEDLDLGYRLSRRWRVLYVPAARCVHHEDPKGRSRSHEYQFQSMRARYAIVIRAFGASRARALAHVMLWMAFQGVSEMAALRKGWNAAFLPAWWGRFRGVVSCLTWMPPANRTEPALFPRAAS